MEASALVLGKGKAKGTAIVTANGTVNISASILAKGRVNGPANSSTSITANGTTTVTANSSTSIIANGTPTVTANSPSSITANGTTTVTANSPSSITANGTTTVTANSPSSIIANGTTTVTANPSTSITANGTTTVTANPSTSITANGTTTVTANPSTSITANGSADIAANGTASSTPKDTANIKDNGAASLTVNGTAHCETNGVTNGAVVGAGPEWAGPEGAGPEWAGPECDDGSVPPPHLQAQYKMIHQAFIDKWKQTDDSMCRHSMSFHLHHALQKDFFASYLYLMEKTPLVKLFPLTCEFIKGTKQFYHRAFCFYKDVDASEEGMLGDFMEISEGDLEQSRRFLSQLIGPGKAGTSRALDCGAGIGRVSKGVLFPVFEVVDMADMMEHFLLYAHEEYLGEYADRVETYFCFSLQDFTPTKDKYDVIWMQWVACHLTDRDLVNFLVKCKRALRPNGVIVLKDNMARQGCKLDPVDSSISRHLDVMRHIVQQAGLSVVALERQEGFPEVIMPVWMLALR